MGKIIIIEDQIEFSKGLKVHIDSKIRENTYFDSVSVYNVGFLELLESVKKLGRTKNLYIIDIDLSDSISGLEFAVAVRRVDPDCYLLFLTSHIELMSQVFVHNLKAINFVFKGDPLWLDRIDATLMQIYHELSLEPIMEDASSLTEIGNGTEIHDKSGVIQYQYKNAYYKISIDKITFIETDSIKRRLDIFTDKEIYHCPWKLKELVEKIPSDFIQIYRSIIVNSKAINRIVSNNGNYSVILNNEMTLPVSKNYIEDVINAFHEVSF